MLKIWQKRNYTTTIFFIIVIFLFVFNLNLYSEPRIQIKNLNSEYVYDWGKITPDKDILSATLPIFNRGRDTLIIYEVRPGCSCTKVNLDKYILPPGDSAKLKIQLHTRGFRGNVSKNVSIISNDPAYTTLYLFLQTNIEYPLVFIPNEYLIFQNSVKNIKQSQSLELFNTTDSTITILEARSSDNSFTHNIVNNTKIKPKEKIKITVNYLPTNNDNLRAGITIKTDYQANQFYRIFLSGLAKKGN